MRLNKILVGFKVAWAEFKKSYAESAVRHSHLLAKDATCRSMQLAMPKEAWRTLPDFVEFFERTSPGYTPHIHGYFLCAGSIRIRQRVRMSHSFVEALQYLCAELERFECSVDDVFPLGPKSGKTETDTKTLDVSMDDPSWIYFDKFTTPSKEVTPETVAIIYGYMLLFGMWWYKDLLMNNSNGAVDALKRLLEQGLESGEIS